MINSEVKKLRSGLYEIFWDSGGSSLASVGVTRSGWFWMAPINWVTADNEGCSWGQVSHVMRLDNMLAIRE